MKEGIGGGGKDEEKGRLFPPPFFFLSHHLSARRGLYGDLFRPSSLLFTAYLRTLHSTFLLLLFFLK